MYIFVTILILIAAILMILIVLVQNSQGGGLASGFSSSNQIMGVRKTTDFFRKSNMDACGYYNCAKHRYCKIYIEKGNRTSIIN